MPIRNDWGLTGGFHAWHGDWVMRMRFWSEITRELAEKHAECFLRAFYSKARSHDPITMPQGV